MATARNTVIQPTSFELPVPQIPLELLASKLESAQGQYDEFGQLTALQPQYLKEHSADAVKLKQLTDTISNDVSAAFASGDTGKAMRMLQQGKDVLKKQFAPGGLAYALQSAYDADIEAKKQLQERFKEDLKQGNSVNYQLAQMQYKVPELGYNPDTGVFNKPSAPDVPTYFDVDKELREWLKTISPQEYGISQIQGDYIYTTEGKKYHIREFAPQFLKDPRIQQQLQLNAQYGFMSMSPEQRQSLIASKAQDLQSKSAELNSKLAQIEKDLVSGDDTKVREAQAFMASQGLEIDGREYGKADVDGNAGKRTKAALDELKQISNQLASRQIGEEDILNQLYNEQVSGITGKALAAKPDSESTKITGDNWRAREYLKHSLASKRQEDYLNMTAAMATTTATPVPNQAIDMNYIEEFVKANKEAVDTTKQSLNAQMAGNPVLMTTFGSAENAAFYRKALQDNDGDPVKAANATGVDVEIMKQAKSVFSDVANRGFSESALALAESQKEQEKINAQQAELTKIFIKNKGTKDAEAFLKAHNVKGITPEQFIANPELARKQIKVSQGGVAGVGTAVHPLDLYIQKQKKKQEEDIQSHYDEYNTLLSKGLRDNSQQYKGFEEAASAYLALPDESGKIEWKSLDGKKTFGSNVKTTNFTLENITDAAGKKGHTLVYSADVKEGDKTTRVVRRVYTGGDGEITNAVRNWALGNVAEALNNNDYTTALRAINIAVGTDDLNLSLKPNKAKSAAFTEFVDGKPATSIQNFEIVKEFGQKGNTTALVTLGNPDNPVWAVAQNVNGSFIILPSLENANEPGTNADSEKIQTANVYKLLEAQAQGLIGQKAAKLKPQGVNPPQSYQFTDAD